MADEEVKPKEGEEVTEGQEDTTPNDKAPEVPEWAKDVPESLRRATPEETLAEVAKSYKNAQALIGKKAEKKPEKPADLKVERVEPGEDLLADVPEVDAINKVLEKAGLAGQGESLARHYAENGKLTDEAYKKLAAAGRSKSEINAFFEGQRARAELAKSRLESYVGEANRIAGGDEQAKTLRQWALESMDKERLSRLNDLVTRDPAFYPEMMSIIKNEYEGKVGKGGTQIKGGTAQPKKIDKAYFGKLMQRAKTGDAAALGEIGNIPDDVIASFTEQA